MVAYIFSEKLLCTSRHIQFKPVLFEGQLCITKINCTFFTFINVTTRKILIIYVVHIIFVLDYKTRKEETRTMRTQKCRERFMKERTKPCG